MNHVPIYRKLRCFIWKQSKTKAIQRLLYFSCSTEKYWAEFFYGVMNYNPFPSFHIVIETQWSIFLFPFHRDVPMGYSSSFFFFFFKIKCNHTVFDSEEVLVIISVKNYLTILCVFFCIFQFSGYATLQIANEPVLPFNALDIALEIQNSLRGNSCQRNVRGKKGSSTPWYRFSISTWMIAHNFTS